MDGKSTDTHSQLLDLVLSTIYISGPTSWNALPATLRDPAETLGTLQADAENIFVQAKLMDIIDFMSLLAPL